MVVLAGTPTAPRASQPRDSEHTRPSFNSAPPSGALKNMRQADLSSQQPSFNRVPPPPDKLHPQAEAPNAQQGLDHAQKEYQAGMPAGSQAQQPLCPLQPASGETASLLEDRKGVILPRVGKKIWSK